MLLTRSQFLGLCLAAPGESASPSNFHCYVAGLTAGSVTIAWGFTSGNGNTIGREARSPGAALLQLGNLKHQTSKSWLSIEGLTPDTEYPYSLQLNGKWVAQGTVRTWPNSADQLAFLVLGDWGNGGQAQRQIALRMAQEIRNRQSTANPVRFILSTGDNIYASVLTRRNSGSSDTDWERPFFAMYAEVLAQVPILAVPGNHDGNESESRADLDTYLDNFFFPGGGPRRWYNFAIGGLAEFIALDSTKNQSDGPPRPVYQAGQPQTSWLASVLAPAPLPWRIAWFHHPMYTAGPDHPPALEALRHWLELFRQRGVNIVFSGHEHNFQYSKANPATGGIQFVVSGAGGELRKGDVRGKMSQRQIAAWAPQHHFCLVELDRKEMRLWPITLEPLQLSSELGSPVPIPFRLPASR